MKSGLKRGTMLGLSASLAFAPLAATAGTRASDSTGPYIASASAESGLQRAAEGEDQAAGMFGFDLRALLVGTGAIGLLVAIATTAGSERDNFQSNGAN